jgi:hypothetical protein
VPLGTIVGLHVEGTTDQPAAINQAFVTANYPGWWLCDAAAQPIISYAGSTFNGAPTPPLNNPVSATVGREFGRYIKGNLSSGTSGGADKVTLGISEIAYHHHGLAAGILQNHNHKPREAGSYIQLRIGYHRLVSTTLFSTTYYQWVAYTGGYSGYVAAEALASGATSIYFNGRNLSLIPYQAVATNQHTHAMNANTSGTSHENCPAYTTLVYIMKVL